MKHLMIVCLMLIFSFTGLAQQNNLYNPEMDGIVQVEAAVKKALANDKHILLKIGGNWCKWCRKFDQWSTSTPAVDSILSADYVVVYVNYSKENKNEILLQSLEFPQRFGFPVFVILDETGRRIHTQNSAYLEEGEGYSEKSVVEFLKHWNKKALDHNSYTGKP
jgi:thioredoxin-related protein